MIMKVSDLEPGDMIRVSKWVQERFSEKYWANEDLYVFKVKIIDNSVYVFFEDTDDFLRSFKMNEDFTHFDTDNFEGQFLEIVSLKGD